MQLTIFQIFKVILLDFNGTVMTIFLKSKNENISLTELAYESAYYDQSHFISDFRKMTGLTPKQFFNDCELSISNFFE